MEFRQLKSFCLIAEFGTVKEAAERCFLTAAAVSLQLKELEKELGIQLFERAHNRLTLTGEGHSFYHEAKNLLELALRSVERTKAKIGEPSRKIVLAASACMRHFYIPAISRFRETYPAVQLVFLARNAIEAAAMIHGGDADLAIGLFPRPTPRLGEITMVSPRLTLLIPKNHRFATKKLFGREALSKTPMIVLQPQMTMRQIVERSFRKENLKMTVGMEASSCSEIKHYVKNGLGLGIVHDICLDPEDASRFRRINVAKLFPHPPAKMIFRKSKILNIFEERLIEALRLASQQNSLSPVR